MSGLVKAQDGIKIVVYYIAFKTFVMNGLTQRQTLLSISVSAPFVTTKLKYQDVIDMLNGMRQGNMKYNYLRMPAEAGQNTFTEAQLLALKTQLEPKGELIRM